MTDHECELLLLLADELLAGTQRTAWSRRARQLRDLINQERRMESVPRNLPPGAYVEHIDGDLRNNAVDSCRVVMKTDNQSRRTIPSSEKPNEGDRQRKARKVTTTSNKSITVEKLQ